MTLPKNIGAFPDCLQNFESATCDRIGIRIRFDTAGEAQHHALRLHHFRTLDRAQNRRLYDEGHPMHGRSAFDTLRVQKPVEDTEGSWWVYIRHIKLGRLVEALSDLEAEDAEYLELAPPQDQLRLAPPPPPDIEE